MTHPDGGPAFFNDCAFGIAPGREALEAYASRLGLAPLTEPGEGVHHLVASGYVRVQQSGAVAILDVAPIGPDYLPGHAHADTLSFELSIGKERVVVNGGTSTYASGPQRHLERSTSSHSTVEINGENSSEVWSAFRVARRARVSSLHIDQSEREGRLKVTASHDGYCRLPERAVHRRTWVFEHGSLTVIDRIESLAPCRIAARFHLVPGIHATADAATGGRIATESGREMLWTANCAASIDPGMWHPEFGKAYALKTLVVRSGSEPVTTAFSWAVPRT